MWTIFDAHAAVAVSLTPCVCVHSLYENENLAYKSEHASVIKAMHQLVIKQWQKQ